MEEDKNMKVLHVIGGLQIGGAETVAMNIYRYINRDKYEFHYLVFGDSIGEYEEEVVSLGGKVIHVPSPSKGYRQFMKNLNRIMEVHGPYDIIHSHTLFNSGLIMYAAKKNRVSTRVTHSHSIQNSVSSSQIRKFYESFMRFVINRNATHLIGCSKGAGNFLYGGKVYQEKGIMLNNGVDVSKYRFNQTVREEIRNRLQIGKKFVIGHVGHLIAVKNQMFLLEIFKQFSLNNRDSVLLLIGDGEDREKLEEKVKEYGLDGSVIFTGNVDNVHLYLNAIDVFVFPSLYEGLPLAVVEAQANGVPCIISDSIPDDVKLTDNIESFPLKESPKAWAELIGTKRRKSAEVYADYIANLGFDVHSSMKIINKIYAVSE